MSLVVPHQTEAQLYVIGEGPQRLALEARLAVDGLTGVAFLIGPRPQAELPEWYSAADLFCLASHGEGCPNVVIEAMACGAPVIATDVGGIGELMTSQADGRLVPTHQPVIEGFAVSINEALNSTWDRAQIAAHGGARSWDEVASDLMNYYASLGLMTPEHKHH